jgi:plastocyanin
MRIVYAIVLSTLLGAVGCKTDQAARRAENIDHAEPPVVAALDPAMLGSVSGTISFKGTPPKRVKIDMSQDPVCGMAAGENEAEQYVVGKKGALANVYVYVKDGLLPNVSFPAKTMPVVIDQKGCRYTPHVIAVQVGEPVEFHNSDPTMHNVHTLPMAAGNAGADISQAPMGAPQSETFQQPEEMLPVRCNNHPWMNAFINVSATPFFAVTGMDGKFEIKGLPPGVYTIVAVHEKMGEQIQQVTVVSQTNSPANFSYPQ